jgi:putative tryptophan/tyrosine transport system substrate-binding protein
MRRREFIALVGGVALAWPPAARAQEPGRVYRLGSLFYGPQTSPVYAALFNGLRRYGFVEGQNLLADPDGYGLRPEQLASHASEIVKQKVDVIVCSGDAAIRAAQQATKIIPILGSTDDMLGSGLVHSMARPEGNTTGASILSNELNGKRQELLMELLPTVRHMAALADANASTPQHLQMLQELARARGVELSVYWVSKFEEIAGAIDKAKSSGAEALNVLASPFLFNRSQAIREQVATLSLPAMYMAPDIAEEGGLIAYGPNIIWLFGELLARQLAALLRRAKVADVPVEQPTKFELEINLKTAKALGLNIPESFFAMSEFGTKRHFPAAVRLGRFSNRPVRVKHLQTVPHHLRSRCLSRARASLRNRRPGPSIMEFDDEVEQSFGRPYRQTNGRSKRPNELTSSIVLSRTRWRQSLLHLPPKHDPSLLCNGGGNSLRKVRSEIGRS